MVRLKFLLFALIVLGLWLGHILVVSPALTARAVEQAGAHARSAAQSVRAVIAERRLEAAELALAVANTPKLRQIGQAAAADRATQLASLVREAAPDALKAQLVVGAGNDAGGTFVKADGSKLGGGAEGPDPTLLQAIAKDGVTDIGGVAYVFVTFPLSLTPEGKPSTIGAVGLPLLAEAGFDNAAKKTGLLSLALVRGSTVIAQGGDDKDLAAKAAGALGPGQAQVVERGSAGSLFGLLPLPIWSEGKMGDAPLSVAARDAITGSPFELVSVANVRPYASALASYQKVAIPAALGLLVLSLIWLVLIGRGAPRGARGARGAADDSLEPATAAATAPGRPQVTPAPAGGLVSRRPIEDRPTGEMPAHTQAAALDAMGAPGLGDDSAPFAATGDVQALGAEASTSGGGGDFGFPGQELAAPAQPFDDPAAAFPFGDAPATTPGPLPTASGNFSFENEQTRAYPADSNPSAGFSSDPSEPAGMADNPDATRVAMIPQELLDASSRPSRVDHPAMKPTAGAPKPPSISMPAVAPQRGDPEQAHFQDVYKEFVATRERCGEPADGLTFDKFVQKLRKNKDQLVSKYNCKTVRFQVYVKDGKAALKATPVKE